MGIAGCSDVWIGHFSQKYPSLLTFDRASCNDTTDKHNLRKLFGIWDTYSDTAMMRERLDKVDPFLLRGGFKKMFVALSFRLSDPAKFTDSTAIISIRA